MKTKHYTALFAFVATFALSAVIASFLKIEQGSLTLWTEAQSRQKIGVLLAEDVANGQKRDNFVGRDFNDYSIKVMRYVNQMENLDDANLPADFQRAWRIHVRAWRNHSFFLMNARNYGSEQRTRAIWQRQSDEINNSWYRVLKIAEKYDAEIPANAY